MGVKRLVLGVVAVAIAIGLFAVLRNRNATPTLHLYTWSNYYPESLLEEFTKTTGIKVELSYFSSNEELFAKLKAGATGFDLIQPSDYMVRQMASLNMLTPLDHGKLPHLVHIEDSYTKMSYDPGLKVSVPFAWGTTGIAVNTKKVPVPAEGVGWNFLLQSSDPHHTSLLDDTREVFSAVLLAHNENPNTKDQAKLEESKKRLMDIKKRILTFNSEPRQLLLRGEVNIAHIFSFDAIQATLENPDIKYFIPKEGGTLWTDNFAIPTTAKKVDEAHRFIDFFLNPEINYRLVTENSLSTPNKTTKAKLPDEMAKNPAIYPPPEVMSKLHLMEPMGDETTLLMNRLWTELKI